MNRGISLQSLKSEVVRQQNAKRDVLAPLGRLNMEVLTKPTSEGKSVGVSFGNSTDAVLNIDGKETHLLQPMAHSHLAEEAGIPKAFYDRLRGSFPELLAENVNTLIHTEPRKVRTVRMLDNKVRAILSDRYRTLDNYDLMSVVLPILEEQRVDVVSSQITESKMYLKVILPTLEAEIMEAVLSHQSRRVNIVVAALTISNSEVGAGSLQICPSVFDTSCTNLAQMSTRFMRKYHIGRGGLGDGDNIEELLSSPTRKARDKAFWMTVKDILQRTFTNTGFTEAVAEINKAASDPIESNNLPAVIEMTADTFGIAKENRPALLTHLVKRGDLSRWGVSSAITRLAGEVVDYEQSSELERLGGRIVEMAPAEWSRISRAGIN